MHIWALILALAASIPLRAAVFFDSRQRDWMDYQIIAVKLIVTEAKAPKETPDMAYLSNSLEGQSEAKIGYQNLSNQSEHNYGALI